jgi:hypothetical protein
MGRLGREHSIRRAEFRVIGGYAAKEILWLRRPERRGRLSEQKAKMGSEGCGVRISRIVMRQGGAGWGVG